MPYRTHAADPATLRRERPWVFAGAVTLAGVAGYINVVLLSFFHVPVSHMSGAVSRLSMDVAEVGHLDMPLTISIIGGFFLGATISGLVIGGRKLTPGRRYGVTLLIEGGVLALATLLLMRQQTIGVTLAAVACGIQNAMASSYYGLIIRTTHVTGIVTDIGVMLGHWIRHRRIQLWKLLLLVSILSGFFAGGILGATAVAGMGGMALAIASGGCLLGGGIYYIWRQEKRVSERAL